ncbi:MAG: hypothetical protein ACRDY7_15945 [Acidimicrobiia bacterium]
MLRWLRNQWDRTAAVVAAVLGAVALLAGWLGASATVYPAQQIPFIISGGLVGVVLMGLGATMWMSADMRDEWRKLDEIQEILIGSEQTSPVAAPAVHQGSDDGGGASRVAGVTTVALHPETAVR